MNRDQLRQAWTPSKPSAQAHDPDVCSLGGDAECDACRARAKHEQSEFWQRDADTKEGDRRRDIARRFLDATGITLGEIANALLPELAEGTAEIVGAVIDERETA